VISAQLLLEVIPRWVKGEISPQPQDGAKATATMPISREQSEIDWHLPTVDIWRRVRAFQPWPGCYTAWQGNQLKIVEALPLPAEGNIEVGRVVALKPPREATEAAFGVGSGDGILGVVKVQMAGKRVMTAAEFLRGQREFIGSILG
jgi:methionyl-tRNA formyltransferase